MPQDEASGAQSSNADEEMKDQNEASQTMMIDTTSGGLVRHAHAKKAEDAKNQRSASLKLSLMLIGTMRLLSKAFKVHLLKGLLDQEEFFRKKGDSLLSKQKLAHERRQLQLEAPLSVILKSTDTVK